MRDYDGKKSPIEARERWSTAHTLETHENVTLGKQVKKRQTHEAPKF